MTDSPPDRRPMRARCGGCGHQWVAAWLPMECGRFVKVIQGLHCPSCGTDAKQIFLASDEALEEARS